MNQEKVIKYATILTSKIGELFDKNDNGILHVDQEDFNDGENLTAFIHALATVMPTLFYNSMTNQEASHLEFNHIANQLVFQFSTLVKDND